MATLENGEGLEAWRRLILEFDPRAWTRAADLTHRLLTFEFTGDTASFELFDKECLRLKQVTGIDIQDDVKCGLLTLHLHDEMLRHHLILHSSRLDTFSKVTAAAGGVAPMHVGAVKGKDKKDHGCQGQRYRRAHASGEGERPRQEAGREEHGQAWLLLSLERSRQERLQKPPARHEEGAGLRKAVRRQEADGSDHGR